MIRESKSAPERTPPSRRSVLRWFWWACTAPWAACAARPGAAGSRPNSATRWDVLRAAIRGRVVAREDPGYEADRLAMCWSARVPDRRPAAIAHVAAPGDVAAAIEFARARGIRVAVRGGGHHFNAPSLQDGSVLLDLAGLRELRVDPGARRATVAPGITGRELVEALAPHGLAFPVGHCGSVPMSGFLLNGGFGWNSGAFGPACASVLGADVVTADGRERFVDAATDPDLYWAIRGAGTRLPAVVTRFHLRLHELPRAIHTSTLVFDATQMVAAARWLADVRQRLPAAVETVALVVSPPRAQRADGGPRRTFVVAASAFAATVDQAREWLAPLANVPGELTVLDRKLVVPSTFGELMDGMDGLMPAGHRYASDHLWSRSNPAELLADAREFVIDPPSDRDLLLLAVGPNRPADTAPSPGMALSVPGGVYVGVYAIWQDPEQDDANRRWVADASDTLSRHTAGRYVGEADLDAGPQHLEACFEPHAWTRLEQLRRARDPDGRFAPGARADSAR